MGQHLTQVEIKSIGILLLLITFNLFLEFKDCYATHAAGSDLTYQSLGGMQYEIKVSFYRDCAGVSEPDSIQVFYRSTSGGYNLNAYATKEIGTGLEITTPCNSVNTVCNGGNLAGIRQFVYRAVVTLPSARADWVFSYSVCCRNCAITTINNPCGNNSNIYVEAKLNNMAASTNSSPVFSNLPIAFVCIGQNFTYNHGVIDADGDSLSYSLIAPKTSSSGSVTFLTPYSATSPIASSTPLTINPLTGDINFTPSTMQIGIMAVLVKEFRNGVQIGSVIRDMQVYTQNCNTSIPVAAGINGTNDYSVTVCPNQQLCFDINTLDADSTQLLTLTTNQGIAGASYTITPGARPSLHFCWTPSFADVDLLPKTFTVTVRDNACPTNGVQTFSYSIFVPSPFFNIASTSVSCHGMTDGTVTATPVYAGNYTFQWNTNPVSYAQTLTGLAPGTYHVMVSDSNACSTETDVIVGEPDVLAVNASVYDALCNQESSGLIDITMIGGTAPYSFLWSDGNTTEDISSIPAGLYTVQVIDANGCTADANILINQPPALTASASATDLNCNGNLSGAIDLTPGGGTAPYTFSWSNGSVNEDQNGIAAGNYSVVITDAHFCSLTQNISISEPDALSLSTQVSHIDCFGNNNGTIDLTMFGGVAPYTYSWSNGAITEDISSLAAGTYILNATDANGCSLSDITIVTQPAALSLAMIVNDAFCNGSSDGSIDLIVNGGSAPYTYSWTNGVSSEDINGLDAGIYSVLVNDNHGCQLSAMAQVSEPDPVVSSVNTTNELCAGLNNGSLDVTVVGGTAPYAFQWSSGQMTEDLNNLSPGNYNVNITDANGCQSSASAIVVAATPVLLNAVVTNASFCNMSDGAIDLSLNGGNAPYQVTWSNGVNTEDISGLTAGNYCVHIVDANGCVTDSCKYVDDNCNTGIVDNGNATQFSVLINYPNPASTAHHLVIGINVNSNLRVDLFSVDGKKVKEILNQQVSKGEKVDVINQVENLASGMYFYVITSGENKMITKLMIE